MGVTVDGHAVDDGVVHKAVEATSHLVEGREKDAFNLLTEMTPKDRNDAIKIVKAITKGMQTDSDRPKDSIVPDAFEERNRWGQVTGIHLGPTEAHNKVRTIYFEPNDRTAPPDVRDRLDTMTRMAQDFFSAEMAKEGHLAKNGQGKTFDFETAPDGKLQVWRIKGDHDAKWYQSQPKPAGTLFSSGAPDAASDEVVRKLPPHVARNNVLAIYYDTFERNNDHIDFAGQVGGGFPQMGYGYAKLGTNVLGAGFNTTAASLSEQTPLFTDAESSGLLEINGKGEQKILSRGEYSSTFVGATIHELGHSFGLPHDFTIYSGNVETNLMGNGFRTFGNRFLGDHQPSTGLGKKSADILDINPLFNQH